MRYQWIIALTLVCALGACQSMPWSKDNSSDLLVDEDEAGYEGSLLARPGLPLATEQRFSDVPLPQGAKQNLDRTYVYESSSLKIGRMVYTVRATVQELAQFYIKESPVANWTLVNVTQAEGANMLFEKPGSQLRVSIERVGVARGGSLLILNLTPTDR